MADWGGLDISGAGCSFDYCTFKYSGNGNNGSTAGAAALNLAVVTTVTNSTFGYNWTCIDTAPGGSVAGGGWLTDNTTTIGNNIYLLN
jgi:hypothetical protein